MTIGQDVKIVGSGAEHVDGVEGAVDRIAMELLNRLKSGKVLVVWAFDASGSLVVEREKLANVLVKAIGKSRTSRRLQDQGLR